MRSFLRKLQNVNFIAEQSQIIFQSTPDKSIDSDYYDRVGLVWLCLDIININLSLRVDEEVEGLGCER